MQSDAATIIADLVGLKQCPPDEFYYLIPISHVAHFTHLGPACNIIHKWKLLPSTKFATGPQATEKHLEKNNFGNNIGNPQNFNVVWFSAELPAGIVDQQLKEAVIRKLVPQAQDVVECVNEKLGARFNSPLFEGSRYGPYSFGCSWADLIGQCKIMWTQARLSANPEYRVLGSFEYKRECMHALLICAENDPRFLKFPPLQDTGTVLRKTDRGWEWRLRSTTDWDQMFEVLAFAIAVPAGGNLGLPLNTELLKVKRI